MSEDPSGAAVQTQERKGFFDSLQSCVARVLLVIVIGGLGYMALRIMVGDIYYVSDSSSFICEDFWCFNRGRAVRYVLGRGSEDHYFCAEHRAPTQLSRKLSERLFAAPNIIGTVFAGGIAWFYILLSFGGRWRVLVRVLKGR